MSVYTIIKDDDHEIQIKTGHDSCDEYHIGDTVKWWYTNPNYPEYGGTLLDGAYCGLRKPSADEWFDGDWPEIWVIIKDHKIHAIEETGEDVGENSLLCKYVM